MEDIRTASKLISTSDFMANIDLKDAYFFIPIHSSCKKYLRYKFEGQTYEFQCLPFGLCSAPFVFTKLMKPVTTFLRNRGHLLIIYLDDLLCINGSYLGCAQKVEEVLSFLESLGFVINYDKSDIFPSQQKTFLGFEIDSAEMALKLPLSKRQKISVLLDNISKKQKIPIRDFAKFLGVLTSACPAVDYGWVYTKQFERQKLLALQKSNDDSSFQPHECAHCMLPGPVVVGGYDSTMELSPDLKHDFIWWKNNIMNTIKPFRSGQFALEIFSDASLTGWGIFCKGETSNGFWSLSESQNHINYLELRAAFLGLQCFAQDLSNKEILLRIDNTTAISYINRMGGVQYEHLNAITREIWQWCEDRQILYADRESRCTNIDTEWELSSVAFHEITKAFGSPDIDLFASRLNAKCSKYISWKRDPNAFNIDAFTVDWKDYFFYCFPPFSLILKSLRKIIEDEASGFLSEQFKSGAGYSTLNTLRSALSLLLGKEFASDPNLSRLLKGVFKSRPSFPKYQSTWDTNLVLDFISNWYPNEGLSLLKLTQKLVALLMLSTGQRVQTLSLIRLSNIRVNDSNIDIIINDLIKTSAPGRPQPHLKIPFFKSKVEICPAKTMVSYMEITSCLRVGVNTERLILTTKKPHHNASTSTIGRWIKQILQESGIDTSVYSAHSVRHAATSAADRRGVSIELIKKAAGWSGNSLVFSKFYNRPVAPDCDNDFANAVLDSD
ncbi:hypothetical protein ABMA27_005269 [Loxostege sticticalis]|uniref:Reverse transcriptase domain-containing protein n=1 Tax=Loxostege sticticalis TaxID=481309 RepID=A0ABR3HIW0_LOXSC